MILSYRFLQNFLPELQQSASQVAEILTKIGFEVMSVVHHEPICVGPCVIGKVLKVESHPNADKLNIVTLKISSESDCFPKIICGASNVRENIFVPVALPGCILPNNMEIQQRELRGVSSAGMICSLMELGLQNTDDGNIWDIEELVQEGQDIRSVVDVQDTIFELDILSNRSDCLSVWGIARELSVACNTKFIENWVPSSIQNDVKTNARFTVKIQDKICDVFYLDIGTTIRPTASSQQMQQILQRHEMTSHHVVLDTAALAMILYGHPLHVYDADKLGNNIRVSQQHSGVKFCGLDGNAYDLHEEDIVISNENGPLCLAGILGGKDSAVTDDTKNICLESAIFSAACIRKSRKKKGIQTKAAFLFERGVSVKQLQLSRDFFCNTLSQQMGVVWSKCVQEDNGFQQKSNSIRINQDIIFRTLGYKVDWSECLRILQGIGCDCEFTEKEETFVSPPSWRHSDLKKSCDLVEEILRHVGYDAHHACQYPAIRNDVSVRKSVFRSNITNFSEKFYQVGSGLGYRQVFTSPLVGKSDFSGQIPLDNPMLSHQTHLRDSFLGGMLFCVQHNLDRGKSSVALMEIDSIFYKKEEDILDKRLLGLCFLPRVQTSWNDPEITLGMSHFLSHIFTFLRECCGLQTKNLRVVKHPPRSSCWDEDFYYTIVVQDTEVSSFGVVAFEKCWEVVKNLSEHVLFYGEVDISALYKMKRSVVVREVFSFPSICRDFAVVVSKNYWLWPLQNYFQNFHLWIQSAEVSDVYEGNGIEEGKISVVFSIIYRDKNKTLTKKDVESVENDLAKKVVAQFEIQLR